MSINLSPKMQELLLRFKKFHEGTSDDMGLLYKNLFMLLRLKVEENSNDCFKCAAADHIIYYDEANKCYELKLFQCNKKMAIKPSSIVGLIPSSDIFFCSAFTVNADDVKESEGQNG